MSYYDNQELVGVERAKLAETIQLPSITTSSVSLSYFESGGSLTLMQNAYTDVTGKFYLDIMTPLVDTSEEATSNTRTATSTKGIKGTSTLCTNSYSSDNYIQLTIPKYIAMNFVGTIPQGTEFLVASVGETLDTNNLRIIGIYSLA